MKLIIGLGNPGDKYAKTRHNAGFLFIEYLASISGQQFHQSAKFQSEITDKYFLNNEEVILAKPQTFMNMSGNAVSKLANFYKISSKDILVCFDDIDIAFGRIKLLSSGGPGTHNGMRSIVQVLGENFPRLKIGIDQRQSMETDLSSYVLNKFTKEQLAFLSDHFEKIIPGIHKFMVGDLENAMNIVNAIN